MKIRIGADELILWLRKNGKAVNQSNQKLGKEIYSIMERLGGMKIEPVQPAFWANTSGDKNIDEFLLPKDAHQYEIEIEKIVDLYKFMFNYL